MPGLAKAGANYMNSQLIKMEAMVDGYAEGIALDSRGFVSEGSGENIFVVRKGTIFTPPFTASILSGITRMSVIKLARDLGYEVREMDVPREALYTVDEVFAALSKRRRKPGGGRRSGSYPQYVDPEDPANTYSRGPVPVWMKEKMIAAGYDPQDKEQREKFKTSHLQLTT
jgi:hypothetical protein